MLTHTCTCMAQGKGLKSHFRTLLCNQNGGLGGGGGGGGGGHIICEMGINCVVGIHVHELCVGSSTFGCFRQPPPPPPRPIPAHTITAWLSRTKRKKKCGSVVVRSELDTISSCT